MQMSAPGSGNLYEKSIGAAVRRIEPAKPRLSAGIVPYRFNAAGELEIYWVRRSKKLRFMGGWHAFPGGRLADSDAAVPQAGELPDARIYRHSGPAAAHPSCALRELFEETGLLAVRGGLPPAAGLDAAREKLLADGLDFAAWLKEHSLHLDRSRLRYAGRWVTPAVVADALRCDVFPAGMAARRNAAARPSFPASWSSANGRGPRSP